MQVVSDNEEKCLSKKQELLYQIRKTLYINDYVINWAPMLKKILITLFLCLNTLSYGVNYDPSNKINQLALTMALLKKNYIDNMSDNDIAEKAIRGLLNQLDPHSDYLDINDFSTLNDATNAQVTGIGVEVTIEDGILKVVAPLDNSPAALAGIKNGDLITHVNGAVVFDIGFNEAISQIKGKEGSNVKITIVRPGQNKPITFSITRKQIKAPTVRSEMLSDDIAYLRISYFGMPTASEVEKQVASLMKDKNLNGLIIDLRNNPGGVLESAIEVSDLFLDKDSMRYQGTIASAKERNQNTTQEFKAKTKDMTNALPVVIIINSGSASGAEIMAGAFKDHKRATIIGEKSFGKGSIQTVLPLSETSAIKITTGLYYTPSGKVVQQSGIDPDIISPKLVAAEPNLTAKIRESDYLKSIGSTQDKSKNSSSSKDSALIENYGIEIYQAMQILADTKKGLTCQ